MDLVDRIHRSSFLGPEFLTWLWCRSEELEGRFSGRGDQEGFELWFDDRLTVGSTLVDAQENIFRGGHPTSSPEAHMALRQGKMATEARLRVVRGAQEWSFVLKAKDLSLSALKIPVVLTKEDDERFYERMYLLEQLDAVIRGLFHDFLQARMGAEWSSHQLPSLHAWINAQSPSVQPRPVEGRQYGSHGDGASSSRGSAGANVFENVLTDDLASLAGGDETAVGDGDIPPWENPILGEKD